MFKKLDPKINLSLTLAIISGICALLLAFVNDITLPIIQENEETKKLELYSELFPEMTTYEALELADAPDTILTYNGDQFLGLICSASGSNGYGSVTALVGISAEEQVVGVEFSKYTQTPGFGDKVAEPSYIEAQYNGDAITAVSADVASGATYSSKLVLSLVEVCASSAQEIDFTTYTSPEADVIETETTVEETTEDETTEEGEE